ncbi:Predicted integral membrane protein [Candidatus Ornithobacterium hominis]|uniref:DUF819 family protein n=1 Tax=Candidatus Ornithobacterium hominis TaxID=2497989 RepID=UPI000E5B4A78|nr:DUF819 family protein [Candidatus Ornithobacterium hominis]SZD73763.1 Predicted integral membrane protein [Candidatus Ornithobacterium hominis]
MQAYFTNDAIVLGLIMAVLAIIFYLESSKKPFWVKFFTYVPSLLLCYFVPALLKWPLGLVDGEVSQLYYVASRYLLPAALILLCLGIDFKGIMRLGPKAIIMFLAGTIGIILGGPIALLVIEYLFPSLIPSNLSVNELWRGMSTIAGSWIGGGANQTAMKEVFEVADNIFGIMIVVDVIVANIWMGFLLYGANIRDKANRLLKADNAAILDLEKRMEDYNASVKKIPTTAEVFILMAVAFGGVALAHWGSDIITPFMEERIESLKNMNLQSLASGFFWLVVIATTIGLALSFTSARKLEGVGATRWGSVFIYVLVATIGMKMDLAQIFDKDNIGLFVIGLTWMLVHVIILLLVAKMIKAPFFFVAVGSQANVGGAASAPIVASAFNPSLASVGVLMAVLGYALGTYGALICAILMEMVATG